MNNFPCYMFILLQTLFSLGASFAKSLVLFAVLRFCTAACLTGFCGSLCVHPGACGTNLPHDGFKLLWLLLGRWLWCYCSHGWLHQRLAYTAPRFQLSSSSFPAFVVVSVRIARFLWSVVKLKAKLSQKPFMQKKKMCQGAGQIAERIEAYSITFDTQLKTLSIGRLAPSSSLTDNANPNANRY